MHYGVTRLQERICDSRTSLTLPSPSLDVPSNGSNTKQHHWHRAETVRPQIPKLSQCVFAWIQRVIVDENLLPDIESIFSRALPSSEGLAIHREDVPKTIVVCWLVSGNNPCVVCSRVAMFRCTFHS